jgi:hypothetical protein
MPWMRDALMGWDEPRGPLAFPRGGSDESPRHAAKGNGHGKGKAGKTSGRSAAGGPEATRSVDRDRETDLDRDAATDALEALECASRRIDVLARELGCLGYFDDDEDRPKAA